MWLTRVGKQKGGRSAKLLLMSAADAIIYLEKKSSASLKYGVPGVELDHIKPKAALKKMGLSEQHELWRYLNLQLLAAKENLAKSNHFNQVAYDTLDIGKEIAVRMGCDVWRNQRPRDRPPRRG